jgi:protein-disulfide isomerase
MPIARAALLALSLLALPSALAPPAADREQARRWVDVVAVTPEGGVRQGNPNAPVKLVEYGSRSCPTCQRFALEGMEALRADYIAGGKVSYEFREFWVHPQDPGLSLLGKCVPLSRFFPLLDAMFAEQASLSGKMDQQVFEEVTALPQLQQPREYARRLGYVDLLKRRGMPEARALQCLNDQAMLARIEGHVRAGIEAGVKGTPTFFLNGRRLDNAYIWSQVESELRAAIGS